jgi:hypothetical protein
VQVIGSAAPVTLQLPAVSTIPYVGVRIEFLNSSLFPLTLQAAGGEVVYNIDRSVGPVKVSAGDWVVVEVKAAADWSVVAGGSGQNKFSSEFASSLAVNGYKCTPDKNSPTGYLIEQWQLLSAATGAGTIYALPIAFPNAYYSIVASHAGSSSGAINVEATPSGLSNTLVTHNGPGVASVCLRAIGC